MHTSYLSAAPTCITCLYTAFIFSTAASACCARYIFFYFNILINAFGNFFIGKFEFDTKITSSDTAAALAATASLTAKKTSKKIIAENITKLAKDVFHIHAATITTTTVTAHSGMPVTIILRFFICIT